MSARVLVWSALVGLALVLPLGYLLHLLAPAGWTAPADYRQLMASRLYTTPWLLALQGVVVYPVWEEIFYRGLMVRTLRSRLPQWAAIAVPNLLFAASHLGQGLQNGLLALIFGLCASYLCVRTQSLFPSMVCHASVNLTVLFVITPIFAAHGVTSLTQPLALTFLAGSIAVLTAGAVILRSEFRRSPLPLAA